MKMKELVKQSGVLMNRKELAVFIKYIRTIKRKGIYLEIGTCYGGSAAIVTRTNKHLKVFTVDVYSKFIYNHIRDKLPQNYTVIQAESTHAAKSFNQPIDILLIDGGHDFVSAAKDIEAWIPKVKVGGLVMFHDAGRYEVPKALIPFREKNKDKFKVLQEHETQENKLKETDMSLLVLKKLSNNIDTSWEIPR